MFVAYAAIYGLIGKALYVLNGPINLGPKKINLLGLVFFFPVPYKSQDYVCAGGGVDQLR